MQAILTKSLPPTNTKPGRIKAVCQRGEITVSIHSPHLDHINHFEDKCAAVARMLCDRFRGEDAAKYGSDPETNPWNRPFVTGGLPDGAGGFAFAHVFTF